MCGAAGCGAAGMSARERSACLGWLLMADSLHRQCRVAKGDLKHYYIHIYKSVPLPPAPRSAMLRLRKDVK